MKINDARRGTHHHRLFLSVSLFSFLFSHWALARESLPHEVQNFFKDLPEKSLTLPFVIKYAMKSSVSFKSLSSQVPLISLPEMKAHVPLEKQTYLKAQMLWDQRENINPMTSNDQTIGRITAGASQYLPTGTALSAEVAHQTYDLAAARFSPAIDSHETSATLKVAQNLWKDAFGRNTRQQINAAQREKEVVQLTLYESFEEWFQGMTNFFYQAWHWQNQTRAAQENVDRRKRLLHITRIKKERGTAEAQELLQVESSLIQAEVAQMQIETALNQAWRELVITLALPEELMKVNARLIPMKLDQDLADSIELCRQYRPGQMVNSQSPPPSSLTLKKFEVQKEVSFLRQEAARENLVPQLQLEASLMVNDINEKFFPTWKDSLTMKNPAWGIGLGLTWPLDMFAEKAKAQGAFAEYLQNKYRYQQRLDLHQVEWVNACRELDRLLETRKNLQNILQKQHRRQQLEERLFEMGRSNTLQVIQAGDDISQVELQLSQVQIDVRKSAWSIRRLGNQIVSWPDANGLPPLSQILQLEKGEGSL